MLELDKMGQMVYFFISNSHVTLLLLNQLKKGFLFYAKGKELDVSQLYICIDK